MHDYARARYGGASFQLSSKVNQPKGDAVSSQGPLLRASIRNAIRTLIPLSMRKRMAIWVDQQQWIHPNRRSWWSTELVSDFAERDVNAYHKFLWAHHLGYASPYEVASRFGDEAM